MKYLLPIAVVLAAALMLAACDEDSKDNNEGVGTVPPTVVTATAGPITPIPPVTGEPTVTASGLQIIDIQVGSGTEATAADIVQVNYEGWLEDGSVFDTSSMHGGPQTFPLSGVIPGWTEGVSGMKVGGKRRLIIPPELAYGASGSPPQVPPSATLTFDIELLAVNP